MITKSMWGTRQGSPTMDGIRADHVARYLFAIEIGKHLDVHFVLDAGCGIGYGSYLMAERMGVHVCAMEIDPHAIAFGERHYSHLGVHRYQENLAKAAIPPVQMITAFEIIEHFDEAPGFLRSASVTADVLVGSVPNQDVVPFDAAKHPGHVRHYTPDEILHLLETTGWKCDFIGSQIGKHGKDADIVESTDGRTLVFSASSAS